MVRGKVLCMGAGVREIEKNSYRHLEEPTAERKSRLDMARVIC